MESEIWSDLIINGIALKVSNAGNIKRLPREYLRWNGHCNQIVKHQEKILSPVRNGKAGYYQVKIHNMGVSETWYIHRLVWTAFNGPVPEGYEIDHLDEDKANNMLCNLSMKTRKQNMLKMLKSNQHVYKNLKGNKAL